MSRALPKELRTAKTSSLPDDLKKIAEELIADKFGIEEEVVTQSDRPFQNGYHEGPSNGQDRDYARATAPDAGAWCGNSFCSSCVGGPERGCGGFVRARVDFQRRQRVYSITLSHADSRLFHDGINKLMETTNCRREDMLLIASKRYIRDLLQDPEARYYFEHREEHGYRELVIGRMFGVKIAVGPEGVRPTIEARF